MDNHLDTTKSVMISAPAGSGKTQKLASRYIALLQAGVDPERILAVTFTDRAAAEMKQRILSILKEQDARMFQKLLNRMPLMRVLTIHSFCGTLLRRFSFESSIDPNYRIQDATDSSMTWEEILYQVLMDAGRGYKGHELLCDMLSEKGFRGLNYLRSAIDYLYHKSPFSIEADTASHISSLSEPLMEELRSWPGVAGVIEGYQDYLGEDGSPDNPSLEKFFLTEKKTPRKMSVAALKSIPDYQGWSSKMYLLWKDRRKSVNTKKTERIREIFRICIGKYADRKNNQGTLDFSDLEYLAYKMLTENPEWANILYAFDEKTDHILVDEFQDTNSFQWEIINNLTEEWRSGLGAKREEGVRPTIFFVGDEKQSIYYFRGANVEIFSNARAKMAEWLGDEFLYKEAKENYRSRPAIVDFTNYIFSRTMKAGDNSPPWITRYSEFSAQRADGKGQVELIILDKDVDSIAEARQHEAVLLAGRINSLVTGFQITGRDSSQPRPCKYEDIAILLRKRTHLKTYEEALRNYGVPFVAVKGIGFYQEPEVALLRALVYFLSNPEDDYSLYILLKSPLFQFDDNMVIELINSGEGSLYRKLQDICALNSDPPSRESDRRIKKAVLFLNEWLDNLSSTTVAALIGQALVSTEAWKYYHEPQRRANIKKLIRIVEDLEAQGKTIIRLRDFFERTSGRNDEPKANVNTKGMDAVKIMTIHASKGLEFPVVFIPGLEDPFSHTSGDTLIYEKEGGFFFRSEPETSIRNEDEEFMLHQAKEVEEQKRLLYVAVTRAEEALFLSGRWECMADSFMGLLQSALEIEKLEGAFTTNMEIPGFTVVTEKNIRTIHDISSQKAEYSPSLKRIQAVPLTIRKQARWSGVTEAADIRRRHGKDRLILGDILHRIFEGISKKTLLEEDITERAGIMLASKGLDRGDIQHKLPIIIKEISALKDGGIWQDIIMPREDSYAELPFVLKSDDQVYSGRIDRVIRDAGLYKVYDYKTFPVKDKEVEYYLKEYAFQLSIYRQAVQELFQTEDVKTYIVFTHTGVIMEV